MVTGQMNELLVHLRRAVLRSESETTDGELLSSFVGRRDGAALAALIERHGPMVWGVCRRLLHNHHDAEDAFQATFLVFVRKAASMRRQEFVANWLYGVARQTAMRARATAARRGMRERQVPEMPEPAATQRCIWNEVEPLLDQELSRLPERYRLVIVLCDLEGKTRAEVARQLDCPEGTVAGRLVRARALLARRLARHGLNVSAGVLGVILPSGAASAGPSASAISSTIQAATLFAAGQATAASGISASAVALSEGVLKAMLTTKLKLMAAFVFAVGAVTLCGSLVDRSTAATPAGEAPRAAAQDRKKAADPKDGTTVRGTLASVDVEKNSITITIHAFDRKSGESTDTNKTFTLAKDAKIQQDAADAKLADLKKGFTAVLKLDKENAVSVSVDGGTGPGEFRSVNLERNTITIIAGRDMSLKVVHLLKDPKVFGADGKPIRLQDLKPGAKLNITRSVEDGNTAVRLQVAPEPAKRER